MVCRKHLKLSTKICFILLVSIFIVTEFSFSDSLRPVEDYYVRGKVRLTVPRPLIIFPDGVSKIYFNPDVEEILKREKQDFPDWQLIGLLKIDSIKRHGKFEKIETQKQLDGIEINVPKLLDVMLNYKIFELGRRIESAIPSDTLGWSDKLNKYVKRHDLSTHYYIKFDEKIDVYDVIKELKEIEGLLAVGVVNEPIYDDQIEDESINRQLNMKNQTKDKILSCEFSAYTPNDPEFGFQWHLEERNTYFWCCVSGY
ncbi:MAG: hypothetical protein DRP35_05885 [Candidatus Zixiibacteriota bacterium]|nr:MAG: hypothetical protein DRP35_05885 [candidate division Zixibacteria bacterium]